MQTQKCKIATSTNGLYPLYELAFVLDSEGKGKSPCESDSKNGNDPACDKLFSDGRRLLINDQVTYRDFPTINIDVHRREYFKEARYNPHALPTWQTANGQLKFFSQRIQTYDHGIKLTAFSFPLKKNEEECQENEACVLALVKLMHTFFKPVLPIGFGFAVVENRSGDVLYHSNDQRSLLENFYVETDENRRLIAAINSHHEQLLGGKYNGLSHQFYVKQLPYVPWSIIVFYDKTLPDLVIFKAAVVSLSLIWLLAILANSLVFLGFSHFRKEVEKWFPNGCTTKKMFHFSKGKISRLNEDNFPWYYVLWCEVFLVLVSVTLVWIIYSQVFGRQIEKLTKLNLIHITDKVTERERHLQFEFDRLNIPVSGNSSEAFKHIVLGNKMPLVDFAAYANVGDHQDDAWMVRYSLPFSEKCKAKEALSKHYDYRSGIIHAIESLLPDFNNLDARLEQIHVNHSSDAGFQSLSNDCYQKTIVRSAFPATVAQLQNDDPALSLPGNPIIPTSTDSPADQFKSMDSLSDDTNKDWWTGLTRQIHLDTIIFVVINFLFLVIFLIILPLVFLFFLIKKVVSTLFGLGFPDPKLWEASVRQRDYRHPYLLNIHCGSGSDSRRNLADTNLARIVSDETGKLRELKAILFNRSHQRLANTANVEPLMWLYHGGIFKLDKKQSGLFVFADPDMKEWVKKQPWESEVDEYYASQESNFWRILAAPFYSVLVLAGIFLVLSGSEILNLFLALASLLVAGGLPFLGQQFFRSINE